MTQSINEFRGSLRKGSGRAATLLQADPANAAFREALLEACTTNLVYDSQCEGGRAPYLKRLIMTTDEASFYWDELLKVLAAANEDSAARDVIQYFELLCLLAADRDVSDRVPLRTFMHGAVARKADFSGIGCCCGEALIRLERASALVDLVDVYRSHLTENIEQDGGWAFRTWMRAATNKGDTEPDSVSAPTHSEAPALNELLILHDACKSRDASIRQRRNAIEERFDYTSAKARGFPRAWVRTATTQDLRLAAQDMLREHDGNRKIQYLRLFSNRDYPFEPATLVSMLAGHDRSAGLAARCLGRLRCDDVRQEAVAMLEQRERAGLALRMLRQNWRTGDYALIDSALSTGERSDDEWHQIGFAILELIEEGAFAADEERLLLLQLYETNPCSICRAAVIRRLAELGCAPEWLKRECAFDADAGTAALFSPDAVGSGAAPPQQ